MMHCSQSLKMEMNHSPETASAAMQSIKENPNLLALFNEIRRNGPTLKSKAGLGLHVSKPTRYALMQELVGRNLLTEGASTDGGRHRHSSVLQVVKGRLYTLGVDVHMEGIEAVLLDMDASVKAGAFLPNEVDDRAGVAGESRAVIIERIREAASRVLREAGIRDHEVIGAGISSAGTVHGDDGIVMASRYMPDLCEVPVGSILSRTVSAPARLARDANMIALAEIRALDLRRLPNALCVSLRRGIGLGAFLHGRMYTGKTGNAGEWSHMRLFPALQGGELRRQDLDTLLGIGPILELSRSLPPAGPEAGPRPGDGRAKAVFDAFEEGRPEVVPGMKLYIEQLGVHLANLVYLFDVDHIIIAGRFAFCGDRFLAGLAGQVRGHVPGYQEVRILKGRLGMGAAALGAACMAQETACNAGGEVLP